MQAPGSWAPSWTGPIDWRTSCPSKKLVDIAGRLRSPAATPGHRAGCAPANKGAALPGQPADGRGVHPRHARSGNRTLCGQGPWADRDPVARRLADQGSARPHRDRSGREDLWTEHRIKLPVGPLFCVLAGPTRGADGQQQLRAVSFAASLPRLAYGGGSHHTSRGMLTRSRWRTKGSRCRLSRGSSACTPRDHVDLPPGNRYARDRRHCAPPPATGDPGERRPAAITGPEGRVVGAWRAPCSSPASGRRPHSGRALPVSSASGSLGGGRGRQPGAASKGSSQ